MKKLYIFIVALIFALSFSGCSIRVHDYPKAIDAANAFLNDVYFEDNLKNAYADLHNLLKEKTTHEELANLIQQAHEGKLPKEIQIIGYGPDRVTKGVSVYAKTDNAESIVYYEVVVLKDESDKYKVVGLWLSHEEFEKNTSYEELTPPMRVNNS